MNQVVADAMRNRRGVRALHGTTTMPIVGTIRSRIDAPWSVTGCDVGELWTCSGV